MSPWLAFDWGGVGGSGDPLAAELGVKFDTPDGPIWVNAREIYQKDIPFPEVVEKLRAWQREFKIVRVWCDPSQLSAVEALAAQGLPALPCRIRSIDVRVRTLYSLLKTRRLKIDPRHCPALMDELRRYTWRQDRSGTPTGKPLDRHNHGLDSLGFYLCGEGETPEEVRDPVEPWEQPSLIQGEDGRWRDNVRATMARRAKAEDHDPEDLWWDRGEPDLFEDMDGDDGYERELMNYLRGAR